MKIENSEILTESLIDGNGIKEYKYIKKNGVKHYWDEAKEKWFDIVNGERNYPPGYTEEFGSSYERY